MCAALGRARLARFEGEKYLNLESRKRNGNRVRTPIWFAAGDADSWPPTLYAYTLASSGKAKRIRRSGAVRIAPCDVRGGLTGQWLDAYAEIVSGDEAARGMRLIDRKYRPWKPLLDLFARLSRRRQRIVLAIRLE